MPKVIKWREEWDELTRPNPDFRRMPGDSTKDMVYIGDNGYRIEPWYEKKRSEWRREFGVGDRRDYSRTSTVIKYQVFDAAGKELGIFRNISEAKRTANEHAMTRTSATKIKPFPVLEKWRVVKDRIYKDPIQWYVDFAGGHYEITKGTDRNFQKAYSVRFTQGGLRQQPRNNKDFKSLRLAYEWLKDLYESKHPMELVDTYGQTNIASELRRLATALEGRTAALNGTIRVWRTILVSRLTQYDKRVGENEARRNGRPNVYRLAHLMKAAQEVEKGMKGWENRDDAEALERFKTLLLKSFVPNFPPIVKLIKDIDAFLATGTPPKL